MAPDYAKFVRRTGVSRETMNRLQVYENMLRKWQPAINLVSNRSLDDVWIRHFLDSAQIAPLVPNNAQSVLDMGSGAGFPGMVLAMLGAKNVHLVESNQRKCQFLHEVARATSTSVTIHNNRVEKLSVRPFDVVTARACAPLAALVDLARPFLHTESMCIFPKGVRLTQELAEAQSRWILRYNITASISDGFGKLIRLEGVPDRASKLK